MSSTPNYGFEKAVNICAMDAIDREIKRIDDKAAQNAAALLDKVDKRNGYGLISSENLEQITRNQDNIQCLSGRVDRNTSDIADRYTKAEMDCKLASKASKCEFEKHLIDPHAHQELLDRKVDKQDGFGLISDEDKAQIGINKGNITIINNKISQMYTQEEVDTLLANKANVGISEEYELTGSSMPTSGTGVYYKALNCLVVVHVFFGNVVPLTHGDTIGMLPVGFRPPREIHASCMLSSTNIGITTGSLLIDTDGKITVYLPDPLPSGVVSPTRCYSTIVFSVQ